MGNAERKARKRAGEPAPIKSQKEPTPLLERTLNARQINVIANDLRRESQSRLRMVTS